MSNIASEKNAPSGHPNWVMLMADILVIGLLIAFDQFTKYLAVTRLKGREAYSLIAGVLELDYLENHGAAFGILQNQKAVILGIGIVFMLIIFAIMFRVPRGKKYAILHIMLSFVIAGGTGNMIDRFSLSYVVDFISFILIDYPVFNVADCYVVCATVGLFIMFMFVLKEEDLEFLSFKKKRGGRREKV